MSLTFLLLLFQPPKTPKQSRNPPAAYPQYVDQWARRVPSSAARPAARYRPPARYAEEPPREYRNRLMQRNSPFVYGDVRRPGKHEL